MAIRNYIQPPRSRSGPSAFQSAVVWSALAVAVMIQISYPLLDGNSLRVITFATVLSSSLAMALHALLTFGRKYVINYLLITLTFAFSIEQIGLHTGWPFGYYKYDPSLGWAIAGAAGATAGILQTINGSGSVTPDAFEFSLLLVFGFVAAVIGGIESLIGAVVGGLTLGVILAIILMYLGSSLVFFAAFLILILVLLLRPQGIIGAKGGRRA